MAEKKDIEKLTRKELIAYINQLAGESQDFAAFMFYLRFTFKELMMKKKNINEPCYRQKLISLCGPS